MSPTTGSRPPLFVIHYHHHCITRYFDTSITYRQMQANFGCGCSVCLVFTQFLAKSLFIIWKSLIDGEHVVQSKTVRLYYDRQLDISVCKLICLCGLGDKMFATEDQYFAENFVTKSRGQSCKCFFFSNANCTTCLSFCIIYTFHKV